jgi:hypothetical protein
MHELETGWRLKVADTIEVSLHNTGAFQRTVDEEGFLRLAKARGMKPSEALRRLKLEELPPCYGVVVVTYGGSKRPTAKTGRWFMPEAAGGVGEVVPADDRRCK